MHMADALVAPAVAGTMYLCSTGAATYSVKKVRDMADPKKIPVMGIMGAFVFATQMINFTIPGTGSSGHLCGGMLLTALLGPSGAFLTMISVLLIQCLLFADGGLLALGCNVWNMAFYGCFVGALIWRLFMKGGMTRGKIIAASIVGSVVTLQMGAFSVVLETLASGITELPFSTFLLAMQPIHLAIGAVEGLITAAVLSFVYSARPELLYCSDASANENRLSVGKTLAIIGVCAALIGGGLSLFASSHPDGLEWALEKVAGTAELEAEGSAYQTASDIQEATAVLPDYAVEGSDSPAGTTLSGVVGSLAVLVVSVLACWAFRFFRHRGSEQKRA